jgi:hypothetical protein
MPSRFKTGDRVRVRDHPDVDREYVGLEGKIVAWVPKGIAPPSYVGYHRGPHPGDFFIDFDDPPPDMWGLSPKGKRIHQGGPWHDALVEEVPPEPTIGEIADLFGIDPYDVAIAAWEEMDE